jgi:hypothetical protein
MEYPMVVVVLIPPTRMLGEKIRVKMLQQQPVLQQPEEMAMKTVELFRDIVSPHTCRHLDFHVDPIKTYP